MRLCRSRLERATVMVQEVVKGGGAAVRRVELKVIALNVDPCLLVSADEDASSRVRSSSSFSRSFQKSRQNSPLKFSKEKISGI